ncbi:hypothetical protein [Litorivivens sp.]|uniref:hypothetical protein n=1 Tax=Litorivivens sp. TaxID=2020868 RepID=UPI00356AC7DF
MRAVYYLIGAMIPLPLFCNVLTGEFLIQKATAQNYLVNFGAPVPVGMFAVLMLGFFVVLMKAMATFDRSARKTSLFMPLIVAGVFFIYAIQSIDILRVISLVFPFLAIVFVCLYADARQLFSCSIKGYITSFSALVLIHSAYIVLGLLNGSDDKSILFSSFFGYTIYQAFISYSAVLSFFGCTLVVLACMPAVPMWQRLRLFLVIVATFFILGCGSRKAVLLDMFALLAACAMLGFVKVLFRFRLDKMNMLVALVLVCLCVYLLLFSEFANRELSYDMAVAQRGGAYQEFAVLMRNASPLEILLGFGGSWGGYSNIFVELIVRLGVLGIFLFIASLIYVMKVASEQFALGFPVHHRLKYSTKVWAVFFILSIIFSNGVNMNLQLPYYVVNIAFVSLYFIYKVGSLGAPSARERIFSGRLAAL